MVYLLEITKQLIREDNTSGNALTITQRLPNPRTLVEQKNVITTLATLFANVLPYIRQENGQILYDVVKQVLGPDITANLLAETAVLINDPGRKAELYRLAEKLRQETGEVMKKKNLTSQTKVQQIQKVDEKDVPYAQELIAIITTVLGGRTKKETLGDLAQQFYKIAKKRLPAAAHNKWLSDRIEKQVPDYKQALEIIRDNLLTDQQSGFKKLVARLFPAVKQSERASPHQVDGMLSTRAPDGSTASPPKIASTSQDIPYIFTQQQITRPQEITAANAQFLKALPTIAKQSLESFVTYNIIRTKDGKAMSPSDQVIL
jgi:hypothetical protein